MTFELQLRSTVGLVGASLMKLMRGVLRVEASILGVSAVLWCCVSGMIAEGFLS
jgi:hypothetical protein